MEDEEIKDGMRIEYGQPVCRHLGYDIQYNPNSETWNCRALNIDHEKLSIVKEEISKLDKRARDLGDGIPVLVIEGNITPDMKERRAITIDIDRKHVWAIGFEKTYPGRAREPVMKAARRKYEIGHLVLDTPETRAQIQEWLDAEKEAHRVARENREKLKDLPRLTMPELAPIEEVDEETSRKIANRTRKRVKP